MPLKILLLPTLDTTASLTANGDIGTRMYYAPEVLSENQRRGRAADVFSLGCVFLEISTVIVEGKGSLGRWSSLRELSGSRLYANCGSKILQWIDNLRWQCFLILHVKFVGQEPYKDLTHHGAAVAELAFLMLDPNPKSRVTVRQLVAMLHDDKSYFDKFIKMMSCSSCRKFPVAPNPNLPLHSVFKGDYGLESNTPTNWDQAKELWLKSHMWW